MIAAFEHALVPVVRSRSSQEALDIARALLAGGLGQLEIAVNNEHGCQAIETLAAEASDAIVGAGSVLDEASAREAVEAGAVFLVSPGYSERIHAVAANRKVLYIPGVLTPTEIMRARADGLDFLKLFPASAVGPAFIKDLAGPFPDLLLMPTGGIDLENIGAYLAAGAYCVGVGGSLLRKELIDAGDWAGLAALAAEFLARSRDGLA